MSREASLGKAKQRSSHAAGQRDARDMGECWIPSSAWPEGTALTSTRQRHPLEELVSVPVFHVALLGTIMLSCWTGAAPGQVYWVPPRLPILNIRGSCYDGGGVGSHTPCRVRTRRARAHQIGYPEASSRRGLDRPS